MYSRCARATLLARAVLSYSRAGPRNQVPSTHFAIIDERTTLNGNHRLYTRLSYFAHDTDILKIYYFPVCRWFLTNMREITSFGTDIISSLNFDVTYVGRKIVSISIRDTALYRSSRGSNHRTNLSCLLSPKRMFAETTDAALLVQREGHSRSDRYTLRTCTYVCLFLSLSLYRWSGDRSGEHRGMPREQIKRSGIPEKSNS